MKNEISRDYYCSAGRYENLFCRRSGVTCCGNRSCDSYHRKHPTRKQYKEEYGEKWKGAIYCLCTNDDCDTVDCKYKGWGEGKEFGCLFKPIVICACTPFVPDKDWRPE